MFSRSKLPPRAEHTVFSRFKFGAKVTKFEKTLYFLGRIGPPVPKSTCFLDRIGRPEPEKKQNTTYFEQQASETLGGRLQEGGARGEGI